MRFLQQAFRRFLDRQRASRRARRRRPNHRPERDIAPAVQSLEDRTLLATFTVTTTADVVDPDDGALSLREAINSADVSADLDTIVFNIQAGDSGHFYYQDDGVAGQVSRSHVASTTEADDANIADSDPDWVHSWFSIQPATQLPDITEAVEIDGYTQPGAVDNTNAADSGLGLNSVLRIELDVSSTTSSAHGLIVTETAGASIRGLVINGVQGTKAGIMLDDSPSFVIAGNYLGTDVSGTVALGGTSSGVQTNRPNSAAGLIGGGTPDARNLISGANGTNGRGVLIQSLSSLGSAGGGNRIQGNLIGTDRSGTAALGNRNGIEIFSPDDTLIGGADSNLRNVISGNVANGIHISNNQSRRTLIQGNYIGVDVSGEQALGNSRGIRDEGRDTKVGRVEGAADSARNIISGNSSAGISVAGSPTFGLENRALIQGNYIGTNADGTAALGNGAGILLFAGTQLNTIGTDLDGNNDLNEGNVISGNTTNAIQISSGKSSNNVIRGNLIGVTADGVTPLGNTDNGIRILADASDQTIGGTAAGAGNIIAHSGLAGVIVEDPQSTNNAILGNSIFSNGTLGIDLVGGTQDGFGVTANDIDDPDAGANDLQNHPVLSAVTVGGGATHVEGTLNSTPGTTFRIEFFSNSQADPSGFGEGETFLGFTDVTTDAGGDAVIAVDLPVEATVGHVVTSTASPFIDHDGEAGTPTIPSSTSEFSGASPAAAGNNPPTALDDSGAGFTTDEDSAFTTASVLDNDSDPDVGDVLTVSAFDTTGTVGSVTNNGDGTFLYNPNGQFEQLTVGGSATDTFSYTAGDGNGGTDTATVTITINGANDSPTANDDADETEFDTILIAAAPGVLSNDTDPDAGDVLAVTDVNGESAGVGAQITLASGALLTLRADGSYDYDPNGAIESLAPGESTIDTFSYTSGDGHGGSDSATVTVTISRAVLPDLEVALFTAPAATFVGDEIDVRIRNNGPGALASQPMLVQYYLSADETITTDDTLLSDFQTFLPVLAAGEEVDLPLPSVQPLLTGDLHIGVLLDVNNDVAEADETNNSASQPITISTGAPTATDNANTIAEDDDAVRGNLILDDDGFGVDSDPQGDPLAVVSVQGAGDPVTDPAIDVTGSYGTLDWDPIGTYIYTLDNANLLVQALAPGESLSDTFTYTLGDNQGETDTAVLTSTITGVNDDPLATPNFRRLDEDTDFSVNGNLISRDEGFGVDTDPDASDVLSVILVSNATRDFDNPSVNVPGLYGTLDWETDGHYEYVLNTELVQNLADGEQVRDIFLYTVGDLHGGTDVAELSFLINGSNDSPVATDNSNSIAEDSSTPAQGNVITDDDGFGIDSDPEGDALSVFSVQGAGDPVSDPLQNVSGQHGLLAWDSNGNYQYQVSISDPLVQALAPGEHLTLQR